MAQLISPCVTLTFSSRYILLHNTVFRSLSSYNVVFYGSDRFSLPSLIKLHSSQATGLVSKLTVVSKHNSLIAQTAGKCNIPFVPWPPNYTSPTYDVGFVVSFGHLLPIEAIQQCTHGIINLHASLLPRWRGASPIHHAILAGDDVTGVTVMKIDPNEFDTGDVLSFHEYKMPHRPFFSTVHNALSEIASVALVETLSDLEGAFSKSRPQSNEGITKASKPKQSDSLIEFTRLSSIEVDRKMRAFDSFITCHTEWIDGTKLRLYNIDDPRESETAQVDYILKSEFGVPEVGSIYYHPTRRRLFFKCVDERWVSFSSVAPAGKKVLSALDFYNGFISKLVGKEHSHLLKIPRARIYPTLR